MDGKAARNGLLMIAMGLFMGIAGASLWVMGGSNGWALDYYGSPGHSARLLIGLSAINILLGSMMYFGSHQDPMKPGPETTTT